MRKTAETPTKLMSKYKFNGKQRFAVFTIHGDVCYLCRKPIDLSTMEIDHILPENLLNDPVLLDEVRQNFGLGKEFNINGPENWKPSCKACNNLKLSEVFEPTPVIQCILQKTIMLAPKVIEEIQRLKKKSSISRSLNIVLQALEPGQMPLADLEPMAAEFEQLYKHFLRYRADARNFELANPLPGEEQPIITKSAPLLRLTPLYSVVSVENGIQLVRGPYGIGFQPEQENPHSSFYCGHCGALGPWNGVRCMTCGHLDEPD